MGLMEKRTCVAGKIILLITYYSEVHKICVYHKTMMIRYGKKYEQLN